MDVGRGPHSEIKCVTAGRALRPALASLNIVSEGLIKMASLELSKVVSGEGLGPGVVALIILAPIAPIHILRLLEHLIGGGERGREREREREREGGC